MRLRVHHKITLLFVLITAGLLFGVFSHISESITDFTYQNIRRDMVRKTLMARALIERSAPGADPDELAGAASADLRVRVTIIGADGTVRGDSAVDKNDLTEMDNHRERPEVIGALAAEYGESRRFSTSVKKDFLYTAAQYRRGEDAGFVRLALPLNEIAAVSARIRRILVAAFVLAFVLSALAAYLASLWISRPIERIAGGARRIAAGNFDNRVFVSGHDEISDLARAFNDMAEQIQGRIQEGAMGKSRLEAVFSSMTEGVLVVDENSRIFLMNQALCRLLNVEQDPRGRSPLEVIRNADIQEMIAEIQSEEHLGRRREILFSLPEQRIMRVHSAPVRRLDGGVSGAVLVFHDITELRRLENIRKEFVANVSHELRTPAASIKGYAETLMDGALNDPENAMDFVRIIADEADRLATLIADLLDLSAIESGKMLHEASDCRLDLIARKVVESLRGEAGTRCVEITLESGAPVTVRGDELGLYRMIMNLVENAVKYNNKNGRVAIMIWALDDHAEIRIRDTGIGIPEADVPRIFERFYRVDKARSRQLGGTGLGLAIVKHIVQAHGGRVSVESVLGEGSVFTVVLPFESPAGLFSV